MDSNQFIPRLTDMIIPGCLINNSQNNVAENALDTQMITDMKIQISKGKILL